jgi:hypothetical protein
MPHSTRAPTSAPRQCLCAAHATPCDDGHGACLRTFGASSDVGEDTWEEQADAEMPLHVPYRVQPHRGTSWWAQHMRLGRAPTCDLTEFNNTTTLHARRLHRAALPTAYVAWQATIPVQRRKEIYDLAVKVSGGRGAGG